VTTTTEIGVAAMAVVGAASAATVTSPAMSMRRECTGIYPS
jgi:hypothetical protein